jgi:hypothetical protein
LPPRTQLVSLAALLAILIDVNFLDVYIAREKMPTEEEKKASAEFGFNPVSRRWVKKTSDTWLRLVKAGVVGEDPELLEALTLKRRETVRAKNQAAVERRAKQMVATAEPAGRSPEPKAVAPKKDRAEVRRRVIKAALDHQSELDGCLDDEELEERLRRLLVTPRAKPRRATHTRHFVDDTYDDEETSDY